MKFDKSLHMNRLIQYPATLLAVLLPTTVTAQLNLVPHEIDVNDVMQPRQVRLTHNGEAVLSSEILSISSGVFKTGEALPENAAGDTHFSDYSYMFDFEVDDDGLITIKPIEGRVEIGTYELLVRSVHGSVSGLINANLRDSIPPSEHRKLNLSEFSYEIELPDYIYGRGVLIELNPDSKNTYSWYMDGELHSAGIGKTSFRAWPEAGSHEISYIARDPQGLVVSQWSDTTNIIEEEAISTVVRKGYQVPFSAPSGYAHVSWSLNDKIIAEKHLERSNRDTQFVTFRSKGRNTLTCLARDSETGDFRRITWSVEVQ
jgi:hypothetical protein